MANRIYDSNSDISSMIKNEIDSANVIRIATGYFSYKIFEIFEEELESFVQKDGKFLLVIGEDTTPENIKFFKEFHNYGKEEFLKKLVSNYFDGIYKLSNSALKLVFDLFNNNVLEIKIGISKTGGIFHPKEYLFESEENNNYIMGSINFSSHALLANYESLVHVSNDDSYDDVREIFDNRWNNLNDKVTTKEISEYMVDITYDELKSRDIEVEKSNGIILREYQKDAINQLIEHDFNGFLEMATGTGKTLTTIMGTYEYLKQVDENYLVLITVPLVHLVPQWKDQLYKAYGPDVKIVECYGQTDWKNKFCHNVDRSSEETIFCIMVTESLFGKNFNMIMDTLKFSNNMLIIDEAHNLTKPRIQELMDHERVFKSKVGLSATPENYLDDERTELLFKCFRGAHYIFDLKRAIDDGHLTKYNYVPYIVDLDSDEVRKYNDFTSRIKNETNGVILKKLLDDRDEVLSQARNKINKLVEVMNGIEDLSYSLVYCSPGNFTNKKNEKKRYIEQVSIDIELRTNYNSKRSKITAEESVYERNKIVNSFKNKEIDMILAIKCLDEGYDIPPVRQAFILHSSRNPSEFVQRRGRVLRKVEGKDFAYIYDFIVRVDGDVPEEEKNRFLEYYSLSNNINDTKEFRNKYIGE